MTPQPPPGHGPIDPRGAFAPQPYPVAPDPPRSFGPPPGWVTPQPPQRRGGRITGAIVTAVAVVLFAGSLLLNGYFLVVNATGDDAPIHKKIVVPGDSSQTIAVVPIVTSLMTERTVDDFDAVMKEVDGDTDVKAVVLRIDTPGGEVTAADEIYHRIETYKTKHPSVPVVVSMGGMATSGGYYAACAADYLVAEPSTLTGNIGVLLPQYNFARMADKYGVDDGTLHSTGAEYKTAGSPLRTPTTQETAYLQHLIDEDAKQFHAVVIKGRQGRLKKPTPELFDGKAVLGPEALAAGLVDELGMPDAAYKVAATKAGLASMRVVKFEQPESLLRSLVSSAAGVGRPSGVSVGGVRVESPYLDDWLAGRPLYLFGGFAK
jgi:protease-4